MEQLSGAIDQAIILNRLEVLYKNPKLTNTHSLLVGDLGAGIRLKSTDLTPEVRDNLELVHFAVKPNYSMKGFPLSVRRDFNGLPATRNEYNSGSPLVLPADDFKVNQAIVEQLTSLFDFELTALFRNSVSCHSLIPVGVTRYQEELESEDNLDSIRNKVSGKVLPNIFKGEVYVLGIKGKSFYSTIYCITPQQLEMFNSQYYIPNLDTTKPWGQIMFISSQECETNTHRRRADIYDRVSPFYRRIELRDWLVDFNNKFGIFRGAKEGSSQSSLDRVTRYKNKLNHPEYI